MWSLIHRLILILPSPLQTHVAKNMSELTATVAQGAKTTKRHLFYNPYMKVAPTPPPHHPIHTLFGVIPLRTMLVPPFHSWVSFCNYNHVLSMVFPHLPLFHLFCVLPDTDYTTKDGPRNSEKKKAAIFSAYFRLKKP